jgi:ribosomal protein L36
MVARYEQLAADMLGTQDTISKRKVQYTDTNCLQSVRRKGGKYVYIICSKNPKHKQRYGHHRSERCNIRLTVQQTRLIGDEKEDYTVQQLAYPFLHTWWRRFRMVYF